MDMPMEILKENNTATQIIKTPTPHSVIMNKNANSNKSDNSKGNNNNSSINDKVSCSKITKTNYYNDCYFPI